MYDEINILTVEGRIKAVALEFFKKLGFNLDSLEVQDKGNNNFLIKLMANDSKLIIGTQGTTLDAIKRILSLIISKYEKGIFLQLEVNDYLEKKQGNFFRHIDSKVDFVKRTGKEYIFLNLSPYERKKIHAHIASLSTNILSKSIGEGNNRKLHLLKRSEKLTIDLDGDDI